MRISDWSSDVCSSDLIIAAVIAFLVILGLLAKNWDAITKFLKQVWERVWSGIVSFFSNAWSKITSGLGRAVAFVRAMIAVFPLIVGAEIGRASCGERVCQSV